MTEDKLTGLEELQGTILGILENYLKLYDRQAQQLHDLQQELQKVHSLVYKLW